MTKSGLIIFIFILSTSAWNAFAAGSGTSSMSQSSVTNVDKGDQLGVGLQVGSLSGINVEYWASQNRTFDGAVTFNRGSTALTLATLWMFRDAFTGDAHALVPYAGAGLLGAWGNRDDFYSRRDNENFVLAAQVPLGIQFLPRAYRFGIFAEVAPSLEVVPATYGFLTGDIGARYYF